MILGADQDIRDIEIKTYPEYMSHYCISNVSYSHEPGSSLGGLSWHGWRTNACDEDILEHDEGNMVQLQGSEPVDNIIPNIVTDAYHAERLPGTPTITNYPNPFNPVTTFNLDITAPGMVNVDLYSVDGRFVAKIFNGYIITGRKQITWNNVGIRSGVYFARLQSPEGITSCKVIILR